MACVAGEFRDDQGECSPCGENSFSDTTNADECQEWNTCPEGEGLMTEGTATTDIECEDCTGTTFSDVDDRSECQDWNTCPEGEGLLTTGSATTDITCEDCVEDDMQYSQEDDRSSCADHNKCPAGEGSDWDDLSPANEADSSCSACVEGETYSDSECYGACQNVTDCDATHYETAPPTVTSDRESRSTARLASTVRCSRMARV